jgi:hypothetical protein
VEDSWGSGMMLGILQISMMALRLYVVIFPRWFDLSLERDFAVS